VAPFSGVLAPLFELIRSSDALHSETSFPIFSQNNSADSLSRTAFLLLEFICRNSLLISSLSSKDFIFF
jgi:hypothetical protein